MAKTNFSFEKRRKEMEKKTKKEEKKKRKLAGEAPIEDAQEKQSAEAGVDANVAE